MIVLLFTTRSATIRVGRLSPGWTTATSGSGAELSLAAKPLWILTRARPAS